MEPVLQRFGDVTIQRVEKPKPTSTLPQSKVKEKSEYEEDDYFSSLDEDSVNDEEEPPVNIKRPFDQFSSNSEVSNSKRAKINLPSGISSSITIDKVAHKKNDEKNILDSFNVPHKKINEKNILDSFNEDDIPSDFSTDSEFDFDEDLDGIPNIPLEKNTTKKDVNIPPGGNSFLENLGRSEPSSSGNNIPEKLSEPPLDNNDDYDYDIKEKLKEMGEISFETVKKGEKSKKNDANTENEVVVTPAKKTGEIEDLDRKNIAAVNMRRNIREVMDETKLDEATLAAQRLEMERLQRVQEQQKLLREIQRQAAQERMQNKVISLLQGNNMSRPGPSTARIGNTVLVKLPNGQTKSVARLQKRPIELTKVPNRNITEETSSPEILNKSLNLKRPDGHLTPSVSIAPVPAKKTLTTPSRHSDSESEEEPPAAMPRRKSKDTAPPSNTTTIDISSDDDCVVVSEPEDGDAADEEDDPTNSGMHTNDEFNQPDSEGRVLINVGHSENDPDIFLAPQIARIIKPHQIGGVRFLYDNVIESTSRFESSEGFGCILAHSMGLGKTLQIVCFSDIFLRHTSAKTILCIMPINTLQNWMAEYDMWLPKEENMPNSPLLSHGEVRPRTFNLHVLNDSHKTLTARSKVINAWKTNGGVLLIGYEQFRLLSMKKNPKTRRKINIVDPPDDHKNKAMFDAVHEALVDPGPDLVICDEGHRIKNSHASISHALKLMKTKRRIVLTGYPLQNNLMEYWCMVDFARPNYLGTKAEFCNMFERPIMNGQCIDSTESDIKLMRYRAHVLHSLLAGFVQRRSHTVLQTALPQKEEYVLLVKMTQFQRDLYETFMNEVVRIQAVPNPLKAFAVCCKIWNHPDVLYNFLKKRAEGCARDIDLEEVASVAGSTSDISTTSKLKKPPTQKSRKGAGKGKAGKKPEASITPYNSETPEKNISLPPPTFFEHSNAQFPSQFSDNSNFGDFEAHPNSNNLTMETSKDSDTKSYLDLSNPKPGEVAQCLETNKESSRNFDFQNNEFFISQFNYSSTNDNASNSSWIKNEEKPDLMKCELSNDSKPKINILSDIKLPSLFNSNLTLSNSPEKKIKIISDIKIEPKEENKDDIKPDFRDIGPNPPTAQPVILTPVKEEIKLELTEDNKPPLLGSPIKNNFLNLKDKEDCGIPYDWAVELLKDYIPGRIENSAKMEILFCIIRESISLGDRLLVFSQSLITLDLIEQFLQSSVVPGDTVNWCKNISYYRLDGSTSALEREKLINEFNSNPKIHLFLVSTRAGSLGINLIGANRVVVLDASWNPCHDTQAVCRVYRYGQRKPCFVYRLVVDNCLEKKIYDRQINKQGMSDRVVDECNPDAHLTMKDVSTLCWDNKYNEEKEKDWSEVKDNYIDVVLQRVLERYGKRLNREPFQHESLLVDRKEKQLSQQEKRLAKKSYEREKLASRQPSYNIASLGRGHRPIASVRPMQQGNERPTRWIPAEHWQRQGMTAQEMTLPLDVVIPTNQPEKGNIVLKAGQKVLVLKSPKGVYMQLESGKIVAIKTAIKVKGKAEDNNDPTKKILPPTARVNPSPSSFQPKKLQKPFTPGLKMNIKSIRQSVPNLVSNIQSAAKKVQPQQFLKNRPYNVGSEMAKSISQNQQRDDYLPSNHNDEHSSLRETRPGIENSDEINEIEKHISMLNNQISIKRTPANTSKTLQKKTTIASVLEKLEESTSLALSENMPFQDSLDCITSGRFREDCLEDENDGTVNTEKQCTSDISDHSDEVTYVSEQPPQYTNIQPQQPTNLQAPVETKIEPQQDYSYNYYNYQPYPPPVQGYTYPQPQTYEVVGTYPPQQPPPQPQYNYSYQSYPAPPPQQYPVPLPQPAYDYNAPPPQQQPMYATYNPYPQQYSTVPPPQGIYPPPQAPPNPQYPDYQYQQMNSVAPNPVQSNQNAPIPQAPPHNSQVYYNS